MTELSPASRSTGRARRRPCHGRRVPAAASGSDRWYLAGVSTQGLYSTRTFPALCAAGLAAGWDEYGENPLRITEAGRKLAAELEEQSKAEQAAKRARPKPSAEGAAAMRLLREIAQCAESAEVYDDGLRKVWRVGSRDGHRASIGVWVALEKAGYIRTERVSSIGGHRVTVTDAGRKRLKSR